MEGQRPLGRFSGLMFAAGGAAAFLFLERTVFDTGSWAWLFVAVSCFAGGLYSDYRAGAFSKPAPQPQTLNTSERSKLSSTPSPPRTIQSKPRLVKRKWCNLTPLELCNLAGGRSTGAQQKEVIRPYKGQWLRFDGLVERVDSSGPDSGYSLHLKGNEVDATVWFTSDWNDTLLPLEKGDSVTVEGKLYSASASNFLGDAMKGITLEKGEVKAIEKKAC